MHEGAPHVRLRGDRSSEGLRGQIQPRGAAMRLERALDGDGLHAAGGAQLRRALEGPVHRRRNDSARLARAPDLDRFEPRHRRSPAAVGVRVQRPAQVRHRVTLKLELEFGGGGNIDPRRAVPHFAAFADDRARVEIGDGRRLPADLARVGPVTADHVAGELRGEIDFAVVGRILCGFAKIAHGLLHLDVRAGHRAARIGFEFLRAGTAEREQAHEGDNEYATHGHPVAHEAQPDELLEADNLYLALFDAWQRTSRGGDLLRAVLGNFVRHRLCLSVRSARARSN